SVDLGAGLDQETFDPAVGFGLHELDLLWNQRAVPAHLPQHFASFDGVHPNGTLFDRRCRRAKPGKADGDPRDHKRGAGPKNDPTGAFVASVVSARYIHNSVWSSRCAALLGGEGAPRFEA